METNYILNADVLDLLFDGKNKAYGAYELRKSYNKRMLVALLSLCGILLVACGLTYWNSSSGQKERVYVRPLVLSNVMPSKPKVEKKKEDPKSLVKPKSEKRTSKAGAAKGKKSMGSPIKLAARRYTRPKIVDHPDQSKRLASMKELLDKKITAFDQEGLRTTVNAGAVLQVDGDGGQSFGVGDGGLGNIAGNGRRDGEGTESLDMVQQDAAYDGDFKRFLELNLRRDVPGDNGAPSGQTYSVRVQFTIAKDGSISNIKALNDPGYQTAQEAIRAIRLSKKWKPAIQNGRPVETRKIQTITFQVTEE